MTKFLSDIDAIASPTSTSPSKIIPNGEVNDLKTPQVSNGSGIINKVELLKTLEVIDNLKRPELVKVPLKIQENPHKTRSKSNEKVSS